jgi:hypothetical protein
MLADTLRQIAGKRLTDMDGEATILELQPPATDDQIQRLEASLPGPLPDEIRDALRVTTGLANGPLESFSLLDLEGFGLDEAFPHAYSVAHDGYGNYWVLDLLPDTTEWGPVFYACHDPPVIAYQAPTLEAFLVDVVALPPDDPRSPIDQVHDKAVSQIWHDRTGFVPQPTAISSTDPVIREFAASLPADALIADLRAARLGDGFAWGRHGPRTTIRRCGTERVWAVLPPPPKPPGLLSRLFGRGSS